MRLTLSPLGLVARLLAVFSCYFLAASLSRLLALGQASPIWIPAGLALAAILVWGYRMAPAVFLAALATDVVADLKLMPADTAYWTAAITASGSTLQATLAAVALRLRSPWAESLNIASVRDALRFAVIVIFVCALAPTAGVVALTSAHVAPPSGTRYLWVTWWVGDVCGMLIVTPLLLVLRKWRRHSRDWTMLTLPIIGVGLGLTLVSAFLIYHLDREARSRDFARNGSAIANAVDRALELTVHDLISAQVLFYRGPVSEATFHDFAESLRTTNPRIGTLSWIPLTRPADLPALEARRHRDGATDYSVFELDGNGKRRAPGLRDTYFPVAYIEPPSAHPQALGFDAGSEPRRRAAMAVASVTSEPSATEALDLIGDKSQRTSILIYLPVYRDALIRNRQQRPQESVIGFIAAAVSIPDLMTDALSPFDTQPLETWLIDSTGPDHPQLLHQSGGSVLLQGGKVPAMDSLLRGVYYTSHFSVGGRDWMIVCRPRDELRALHAFGLVVMMLLGGFGLTLMLATYMVTRQRNEREFQARDDRLLSQNAVLTLLAQRPLATADGLPDAFRELVTTAATTLQVARASIWLLEDDNRRMRCQCLYQGDKDSYDADIVLDAVDYPRYFATLLENRRIAADDAANDPRTREFLPGYLAPLGIGAKLDAPIRAGGDLIGVICHEHVGPARTWTLDEQNFAGSMGEMASLMTESARRSAAETALHNANQELEAKVAQRTEQLHVANERLREIDKLKSMFIASMSHELRTPLNSIIGFTGVVLQGISGAINERQKDQLTRVFNSARHLLSLISDVIDISKIEAGYVEVYRERIAVHEVIEEALASVQPQRSEKGLDLAFDLAHDAVVISDRKRLLQCVLNLLSNAVKYTERGRITVRLRNEGNRIVIEVEDTGIGIAPEAQKRLFEPFERIDSHLRIRTPGTGLGLYLTRKIAVELLRGGVEAESTPGSGSSFRLWIPRQTDDLTETPT